MAQVSPFHSKKNPGVYHVCSRCTEGNNIEKENKASGTGGGSLCNWQYLDNEFGPRFRASNLEFLKRTLTVEYITEATPRALHRLGHHPDRHRAEQVCAELQRDSTRAAVAIIELVEKLEDPDWSNFDFGSDA